MGMKRRASSEAWSPREEFMVEAICEEFDINGNSSTSKWIGEVCDDT